MAKPIIDKRHFFGTMNQDVEDRLIKDGQVRFAENVINLFAGEGNSGAYSNIKGHKLVLFLAPLTGSNMVIGGCKDLENNAIIFFNYNSLGKHGIYRYYVSDNSVEVILLQNITSNFNLNFSNNRDFRINHSNVIAGLLLWTDGLNPPRKLNIDKAINVGSTGGYDDVTEEIITAIKYPPVKDPSVSYGSDSDFNYNLLRGELFQFNYRFVYDDDEKSVWSPISKVPLPDGQELSDGTWVENQTLNNYIRLKMNMGSSIVRRIEVGVRQGNLGDFFLVKRIDVEGRYVGAVPISVVLSDTTVNVLGGFDTSKLVKGQIIDLPTAFPSGTYIVDINTNTITVSNAAIATASEDIDVTNELYWDFYNNEVKEGLDQGDVIRPFDFLPRRAYCQELVEKNRIIYSNYLEGYDSVDIDVELDENKGFITQTPVVTRSSQREQGSGANSGFWTQTEEGEWDFGVQEGARKWFYAAFIIFLEPLEKGSLYTLNIKAPNSNGDASGWEIYSYSYYIKNNTNFKDVRDGLADAINNDVGYDYIDNGSPPDVNKSHFVNSIIYAPQISVDYDNYLYVFIRVNLKGDNVNEPSKDKADAYLNISSSIQNISSFKKGVHHPFGIVYYDNPNRSGAVNIQDASKLYIPYFTETYPDNSLSMYKSLIDWKVKHQPPEWATHYQWLYAGKVSYSSFFHYYIDSITPVTGIGTVKLEIDINSGIEELKDNTYKSIIPEYTFEKGDRIRFMYNVFIVGDSYTHSYISDYVDLEILGQKDTGEIVVEDGVDFNGANPYGLKGSPSYEQYTVVEIYNPLKSVGSRKYYEMGEMYEIGNPGTSNRYHKGASQDQSPFDLSGTPAKGTFNRGDIYIRFRYSVSRNFWVEDERYSDYYESNAFNLGRSSLVDEDIKQKWFKQGNRYSGKKIQQSQINQLNKFEYDDVVFVKEKYGDIKRIIESGYVLKVIQVDKVNSIYVGRQTPTNPDGTEDIILTDRVLGTIRVPEENYGTLHPESVVNYNRYLYFFDVKRGCVVRDAPNGMISISDYDMRSYFTEKSYDILKGDYSDTLLVQSFYDERHDLFGICFGAVDRGFDNETLLFSNKEKGWVSFINLYKNNNNGNNEYPECFLSIGQRLISFIKANLWVHHINDVRNNFYGTQFNSKVQVVFNKVSNENKVFQSLSIISNKVWYCPNNTDILVPIRDAYPSGMSSRLKKVKFRQKEGVWFAEFLQDINTPGYNTEIEALLRGRDLRGQSIKINLINDDTVEVVLFESEVKSVISE